MPKRAALAAPLWRNRVKELRYVSPRDLDDHPLQHKVHPDQQRSVMRGILQELGIADVLLAYESPTTGRLTAVDGHLRKSLGDIPWPTVILDVDDAEAAYILAVGDEVTSLALKEQDALARLLHEVQSGDSAVQQLLSTMAEREGLVPPLGGSEDTPGADVAPQIDRADELRQQWGVEVGQCWSLGAHRVICGDCTDTAVIARLMQGQTAILCHADPPYGMGKEAEGIANDNLYASKLDAFQMRWWHACRASLADNASVYLWGNAEDLWRLWYVGGLQASERLTFRNEVVWDKAVAGENSTMLVMGVPLESRRMYQPTERCLFFMLGEQGFSTNADNYWEGWEPIRAYLEQERLKMGWDVPTMKRLVGHSDLWRDHWTSRSQWSFPTQEVYEALQRAARGDGFKRDYDGFKRDCDDLKRDYYATRAYFDNTHDNMTDVWSFPRVKGEERHDHPTPKPVAVIERMVRSSTPQPALVLDPFLGSGTTLVACENLGRTCYGCEIDPGYTAVTLERFLQLTGTTPVLMQ